VATEDSEVVRITRMLFQRLIEEYPSVAGMIEARIVANIRALGKDLEPLARYFG
jgi:CRP-like cAMP-binding protein